MKKHYYGADALNKSVTDFEDQYGVATEDVHAADCAEQSIEGVPHFTQHVWAAMYDDLCRLTAGTAAICR